MRILVTGAAGQLGSAIVRQFAGDDLVACTRQDLDVTSEDAVARRVADAQPDVLINCSAYNDVDGAEDDPSAALAVNAFAVLNLARAARTGGATLVHYGTDFIFDGRGDRPYTETDDPQPESAYAMSKLLGEWFAADAPRHYVLRVESLFGGTRAKSSVDRIVAALRAGQPARVFSDRTVTPSFVDDVAHATARVLSLRPAEGVYHCVNSGITTWQGIAEEAARLLGVQGNIIPMSVASVKMKAKRPQYCALSNDKLRAAGIDMPTWQDALARYLGRRP